MSNKKDINWIAQGSMDYCGEYFYNGVDKAVIEPETFGNKHEYGATLSRMSFKSKSAWSLSVYIKVTDDSRPHRVSYEVIRLKRQANEALKKAIIEAERNEELAFTLLKAHFQTGRKTIYRYSNGGVTPIVSTWADSKLSGFHSMANSIRIGYGTYFEKHLEEDRIIKHEWSGGTLVSYSAKPEDKIKLLLHLK